MEPRSKQMVEQYRQHFGGMNLSDEDMLRVISTVMAICCGVVDEIFRELLSGTESKS